MSVRKHSNVDHLCDLFSTMNKGDEISRDQIVKHLDLPSWKEASSFVHRAITRMRARFGKVFKLKYQDNLRFLLDEEIATDTTDQKKANRSAKRQLQKYECVDRNNLSNAGKLAHDANIMRASIQETVTGDSSLPIIKAAIKDAGKLSLGQTLDLFK